MTVLLLQSPPFPMPAPPTAEQFQPYGFDGMIFYAFLFFVFLVLLGGWKFFSSRDKQFFDAQDKRDLAQQTQLDKLGEAHSKAVERVASVHERATTELIGALRDMKTEVALQSRVMSEDAVLRLMTRALKDAREATGGQK